MTAHRMPMLSGLVKFNAVIFIHDRVRHSKLLSAMTTRVPQTSRVVFPATLSLTTIEIDYPPSIP
jgi:hypothetical protein